VASIDAVHVDEALYEIVGTFILSVSINPAAERVSQSQLKTKSLLKSQQGISYFDLTNTQLIKTAQYSKITQLISPAPGYNQLTRARG
jgi:hypothetical protein